MANLYESILSLCERDGIRPGRLCDELGISRGLMTDLKMGRKKSVSAETAQKIADYFGVTLGELFGEETAPTGRAISDADIKFALFGGDGEITDEMYAEVKKFAAYIKHRNSENR